METETVGKESDRLETDRSETEMSEGPELAKSEPLRAEMSELYEDWDDDEEEVDDDEDAFVSSILDTDPSRTADSKLMNGQMEVSDLILAAIGVMKHRKARPDMKRICNWIHRRHGKSYADVADELQRLVEDKKLVKVDYKGSSSFRIVDNSLSKVPRKKRMSSTNSNLAGKNVKTTQVAPTNADVTLTHHSPGPSGTNLRAIVLESFPSSSPPFQVEVHGVANAVAASKFCFNKSSVLANLRYLLDQEALFGHFAPVSGLADAFVVKAIPKENAVNTIACMAVNETSMPLPSSPIPILLPRPECVPSNNKSEEERQKDSLIQETVSKMTTFRTSRSPPLVSSAPPKEPIYLSLREKRAAEIQKKNARKRPKNDAEFKLPNHGAGNPKEHHKAKRLREAKVRNLDMQDEQTEPPQLTVNSDTRNAREEDFNTAARPGSLRKKKSRKIFDPADHEPPIRKRKSLNSSTANITPVSSSSTFSSSENLVVVESKASIESSGKTSPTVAPLVIRRQGTFQQVCRLCGLKGSKGAPLLKCKECQFTAHPACMEYSVKLGDVMLANAADWLCINCKKCSGCNESSDDELMLFCDSCDRGYHLSCHNPPVPMKPVGMWECSLCKPQIEAKTFVKSKPTKSNGSSDNNKPPVSKSIKNNRKSISSSPSITVSSTSSSPTMTALSEETAKSFLNLLPPQLHPCSNQVPEGWETYPLDPNIPDVQRWNSPQICDYFAKQGFPDEQTVVFINEEIDGNSLLLLSRSDVISSLGLKLGPALKMYHQVRRLQTRRNFPAIV